jgi:hypothetical protein
MAVMQRFVLLLHYCPNDRPRPTHCDLMFEAGESLATWVLATLPADWHASLDDPQLKSASNNVVDAERLPDHRLAYLDYEGPVSSGRGSVRRLDAGTYATASEPYEFVIEGGILRGSILLRPPSEQHELWRLTFTVQRMP